MKPLRLLALLLAAVFVSSGAQSVTVMNQTLAGSATDFLTPTVTVATGFTSATFTYSISNPANGNAAVSIVVQGSNDGGTTWFDMFGLGSQNGSTSSGNGRLGTIPGLTRAKATWNNSFVVSISLTLLP